MKNSIPEISKTSLSKGLYPLSFGQQQLIYLNQTGKTHIYNMPIGMHLIGTLDINLFEDAQKELLKRHSILRTSYKTIDNDTYQAIVLDSIFEKTWKMQKIDLTKADESDNKLEKGILYAKKLSLLPIELNSAPLFKSYLLSIDINEYIWIFNIHHSIFDGHSQIIFFNELAQLYNTRLVGKAKLPDLPIEYKDYAFWQTQYLAKAKFEEQLNYWEKNLAGSVPTKLSYDYSKPEINLYKGDRKSINFPDSIKNNLKLIAEENGASLFMVLVSLFKCLLFRFTGEKDITIGTVTAGRKQAEIRNKINNIVGYFANTIVLRTNLEDNFNFIDLLEKVKETIKCGVYENSAVPFQQVVERLKASSVADDNPLFNILFVFQEKNYQTLNLNEIKCEPLEQGWDTAKFDLAMELRESEGIVGFIEYNPQLYSSKTIENLIEHFSFLCEKIAKFTDQNIGKINLTTEKDQLFLKKLNQLCQHEENNYGIHDIVLGACSVDSDDIAIKYIDNSYAFKKGYNIELTYGELANAIDMLALSLLELKLNKNSTIGICVPRSPEMVIAFLAILRCGYIAVPLETRPIEKNLIKYKAKDSNVQAIIYTNDTASLVTELFKQNTEIKMLAYQYDTLLDVTMADTSELNSILANPEDIAYIEYTSGTTGFPKGVPIKHIALTNWSAYLTKYSIDNSDKIYLSAPLTFDACIWEMLCLALSQKAQLIINSDDERLNTSAVAKLFGLANITITTFTPTMLKQFSPNDFPYLSLIIVTGENLFYEDMQPWLTAGVAIINGYGPTEIGVGLTMGQFKKIDNKNNIPISHIGQPIPNTYVYIIDDNNQIAPVGAYGQIAVGGVGLTPGYLNLPDLTDLAFKKIYLNDEEITVYLTGDKGKFNAEGYLEISGRINANNQVKINGVRLELDNVKINLCKHPQIIATEVLVTNTSNGDKCIACYIVPKNTDEVKFSAKELTALLLKQGFPPQALPLSYYIIDAVPMTTNGKVDTQSLISKYSKSSLPSLQYIKPETDIQFRLAAIFREVLAISANKQVSINDHFFFDLGGSSLLASKLRHRIREEYGYDAFPSLSSFFSEPTIEYLANHIQSNRYDLINTASFTLK